MLVDEVEDDTGDGKDDLFKGDGRGGGGIRVIVFVWEEVLFVYGRVHGGMGEGFVVAQYWG